MLLNTVGIRLTVVGGHIQVSKLGSLLLHSKETCLKGVY